ncbi:hypothetical protein SANTM175S_07790 [Streptomyces antimycoticus]
MEHWYWPVGVLVFAIIAEGFSFRTAINESNEIRGELSWSQFVRRAKAPELPVVLLEDFGALIGLVLALGGVGIALLTGDGVWDGIGTLCIGVLLVLIALVLAAETKSLLLGEAADVNEVAEDPRSGRGRRDRHQGDPHAHAPPRPRGAAGGRQDRRCSTTTRRRRSPARSTPRRHASARQSPSPA